ncbi:MAG TPA: thiamine pyrophosphate-dependent dehydrogenase E1 component subunit alpha [Myxococcota bacterium]|nr:thiamine pyrophosphate-dependent dehydrogenase E1 component subunit alpha [Myxococcota bacterium]
MAIEPFQILDEEGRARPDLAPDLPGEDHRRLFEVLLCTRRLDERMLLLQRQGRIGFYLGCTGEEAVAVASAYALRPSDWIFPCYREHGAVLWRGMPLGLFVAQCYGSRDDITKGRQMPIHYAWREANVASVSSPVATQIPHATGMAMAARLRGSEDVALVFFGEGSSSGGEFHVGVNFAGVFKAPVVFVCRNNGWAISTPASRQSAAESYAVRAVAYGIQGELVDGNDILAMVVKVREAAARGRRGEGPTLIEARTYRMGAHSSSDDPKAYRDPQEPERMKARDPLVRYRKYLAARGLWTEAWEAEIEERFAREVSEAIARTEKAGPPPLESLFEDVYAEPTPELVRQRQELAAQLGARRKAAAA